MTIYKGSTDISECICIGWEGADGLCASCVAGKYRSNLMSDACTDCAAGKFSQVVDAQTDTCAYCGAGTYAADNRSICLQCPADHLKSSAGPEGCWGALQSVDVAQQCVVAGVTGPCEISVHSERSDYQNTKHKLLDGVTAVDQSQPLRTHGLRTTNVATIVIDLHRFYTLSHVQLWLFAVTGYQDTDNIASMSDSRRSQSQQSCSDGTLNVCVSSMRSTTHCAPGAIGRFFCIRVLSDSICTNEVKLFALLWPPCPAHRYRRGDMCVECPANSQLPSNNTATACTCNTGFSSRGDGTCYGCVPGTYRNALGWQHACSACPAGSTSPEGSVGISQCVCAGGVDIAEYV